MIWQRDEATDKERQSARTEHTHMCTRTDIRQCNTDLGERSVDRAPLEHYWLDSSSSLEAD